MIPQVKRLLVRASLLALVVNAALLFAKYKERGPLLSSDYLLAAKSMAVTLALLGLIAFTFSRLNKGRNDERR